MTAGDRPFDTEAATGWRVKWTPIRVVDRSVTFRLRWLRARDGGKEIAGPFHDIELTLRPGESRQFDRIPVPVDGATLDNGPCRVSEVFLRVSVDHFPLVDFERRLVEADLWLIERLANGRERSQALSVRGLPNRPIPFYFDEIVEGPLSLELFGNVSIQADAPGGMKVSLETRSRSGETSFNWQEGKPWDTRWVESAIDVVPQEIVEVRLPRTDGNAGPFANRLFSIRIRIQQVR